MWRATIRGLLARKARLALTALSVVLGVSFVCGTFILTDTMGEAFDRLIGTANEGVAVEVTSVPKFEPGGFPGQAGMAERVPATLVQKIRAVEGVRTVAGSLSGYAQLVDEEGEAVSPAGAPTIGVAWTTDDPALNPLRLRDGRAPRKPGEIVVDARTAGDRNIDVGDRVTVLTQGPSIQATVVGVAGFGDADNLAGATLVAFDPATAQTALRGGGQFEAIAVTAEDGVSAEELRDRVAEVLPEDLQAKTGQQASADISDDIKQGLGFFQTALLVFGFIALFVGAFIIFNTFQILVAQRTRELGLLRALGASPRQIQRSVIAEGLLVGVFASVVGIGAGVLIAIGLRGLLSGFGIDLPSTTLQLQPRTIIVALVVGIVTTLVSSIVPARRASRIPPIAALREAAPVEYRTSRRRVIAGVIVTSLGIGTLMLGLLGGLSDAVAIVGAGVAAIFIGVTILSPIIARPVARFIGAPLQRISRVSGKLGRENAMRNPSRTASTASALMIGLALVTFIGIFAASAGASTEKILSESVKADYIVSSTTFSGFSQDVARQLRTEPAFTSVSPFRFGIFGYEGRSQEVQAIDPATAGDVMNVDMTAGSLRALGDNELLVDVDAAEDNDWQVGQTVEVEFVRTGKQNLRIVGMYSDARLLGSHVISLGTYERNFVEQLEALVLVKTAPGVSRGEARAAADRVTERFPNVKLENQVEFRESQAAQLNQIVGLVTSLLSLAIWIAAIGIVNTLTLSIYERTREIGLLRAVGMSRRQVSAMIRSESVIIAVFGALLGTVVGGFFGWAMVRALADEGLSELSIPAGQLLIYLVVAALIGVLAAIRPARRAGKLDVLAAISHE